MDYDMREVAVARAIVENARRTILVCDRLKFERSAPVRICDVADIHAFVTDAPPPPRLRRGLRAGGGGDRGGGGGGGRRRRELRPRGHRRRGQRLRHRPRRGRARAEGGAGRAGGPGAGDLVGLDQAVPRRPALSRVLRVPAGARGAGRARDAARAPCRTSPGRCASCCRTTPGCGRPGCCGSGSSSTTTSAGGRSCRRRGRSTSARDPAGAPLKPGYREGVRVFRLLGRRRAAGGAERARRGGARGARSGRAPASSMPSRDGGRLAARLRSADGPAEVRARAVVNAGGPWVGRA